MAKSTDPYLVVESLAKHYGDGEARVQVLDGITTTVNRGEVCVMLGPSGSGKSTFLHLIGGLEGADGGTISVGGIELTALPSKDLGEYRRRELGFVFSSTTLCPISPSRRTSKSRHTSRQIPCPWRTFCARLAFGSTATSSHARSLAASSSAAPSAARS